MENKKVRESGIELLKILAILFIIISHVIQTLANESLQETINLNMATQNVQHFILICLRHLGVLGNLIFVICSSWFLIGKRKSNKKKMLQLILDVFIISIIMVAVFLGAGINISKKEILKSLLPTTFANNWFVTCYILFLMVIPLLNDIVEHISKKQLLRINIAMLILYWIINFVKKSFFCTDIIIFITIFFIVAYIKLYLPDFTNNKKTNILLLCFGIVSFILLIGITNVMGNKIGFMEDKLMHWCKNENPILLLISISLFNLFKNCKFINRIVNLLSSLSLYIYIIHDNIFVRNYFRLYVWDYIYERFKYNHIILETLIYASMLFVISLIISLLYKYTFRKMTSFITNKLCNSKKLSNSYIKVENRILNIK